MSTNYVIKLAAQLVTARSSRSLYFKSSFLRFSPLVFSSTFPSANHIGLQYPATHLRRNVSVEASDLRKGDIIHFKGKRSGSPPTKYPSHCILLYSRPFFALAISSTGVDFELDQNGEDLVKRPTQVRHNEDSTEHYESQGFCNRGYAGYIQRPQGKKRIGSKLPS